MRSRFSDAVRVGVGRIASEVGMAVHTFAAVQATRDTGRDVGVGGSASREAVAGGLARWEESVLASSRQ